MFNWLGRSRRTRQILNEMYGSIEKSKTQRAKKEIGRYNLDSAKRKLN